MPDRDNPTFTQREIDQSAKRFWVNLRRGIMQSMTQRLERERFEARDIGKATILEFDEERRCGRV